MQKLSVVVLLAGLWAQSAMAGVCEDLAAGVEQQVKSIALTHVESTKTVHQETNQILTIANHQRLIQINLELMAQNKCPPLPEVPSYALY